MILGRILIFYCIQKSPQNKWFNNINWGQEYLSIKVYFIQYNFLILLFLKGMVLWNWI